MILVHRLAAEFVGTLVLVFGGCGSAVISAGFPGLGIGFLGVAMAFGLTVLVMIYAVGHISGGHFNPAVTLGAAAAGRFAWKDVPLLRDRPGAGRGGRGRAALPGRHGRPGSARRGPAGSPPTATRRTVRAATRCCPAR